MADSDQKNKDIWKERIQAASALAEKVLQEEGIPELGLGTGLADQAADLYEEGIEDIQRSPSDSRVVDSYIDKMPVFTLRGFFVGQLARTSHLPPEDSGRNFILRMAHSGLTLLAHKKFENAQACAGRIVRFDKEEEREEDAARGKNFRDRR